MTHYAGLDISTKSVSIAIVDEKGKICFETVCETDPETLAKTLIGSGFVCEKIGIESGCMSFWLIEELEKFSLKATCIESRQTLYWTKVFSLGTSEAKSDRFDGRGHSHS